MKADDDPPARSPSRPRKTRDDAKRETREALIAAGVGIFTEQGLDTPSLDAICARAGYTRGAFYVHFKDRDDFIMAVLSSTLEGFMNAIIATGDAALDLQKTIDTFVTAVRAGAFPIKHGIPFHQFMAVCARSPRIRDGYVAVLREGAARITNAVREGQGAGTVRTDVSPESLGLVFLALALGVQAAIEVEFPVEPVVEAAARDLSRMLEPR
ncbi:MAG TPA: TetR/AcrR family transcriptional regulator [Polyangiaceae bacterium]|nr:TetR/AcrR family transcriptional regulator [Polyangiaceae bacterium]